jgi:hypothetical protein
VARPAPLSPFGLLLETRVNVFGLGAFGEGLFEVMDEGSQLVAEAVAPPPGGKLVDACAGAGGKTLALAALLGGQGRILALDPNGKKLEELRRRARRAGLSSVAARELKENRLPDEARLGAWDRVLVDVPCSGLGTLRRNPEARWRLRPATVDAFPAQQLSLLVTYAPLVAGGRAPRLRHLLRPAQRERSGDRALLGRASRLRPHAGQGDLGQGAGAAPRRRHRLAPGPAPARHRRLLRGGAETRPVTRKRRKVCGCPFTPGVWPPC